MSHDTDIQDLLTEENELRAKLEGLKAKRQEIETKRKAKEDKEKAEKERNKEVTIYISSVSSGVLIIDSLFRPDILEIWKSTPGRSYRGYQQTGSLEDELPGRNAIPIAEWPGVEERLSALHNVTISWTDEASEKYNWILSAPPWEVDLDQRRVSKTSFICKQGPNQSRYGTGLSMIPGCEWNYDLEGFLIPLSEGWRIPQALENIEGVTYTESASAWIFEQVENRAQLDLIARKEDSDFFTELNGHPLRGFQKVAVEFIAKCGGRMILADPTGVGKTWEMLGYAEHKRKESEGFTTLCVVKAANMRNWEREIIRLTGTSPAICKNSRKEKDMALFHIMAEKVPYILISHDMLGTYEKDPSGEETYSWVELFKALNPDLLLLDEAHAIKNPSTHRSKATRKMIGCESIIAATASPVLNRTDELWPLLYMVNPAMFGSHERFKQTYTYDGRIPKNVEKLHEMLRPIFLRRERSVIQKDLPPINRIQKIHELSGVAQDAYALALKGLWRQLKTFDHHGRGGQEMSIVNFLAEIMRLKQICSADKTAYTADLASEIIDENEGAGKVLIFTQFKGVAIEIASLLGHEAVCTVNRTENGFYSMDADQRDELFEAARGDESIKYLVTTEAAKEGHNLEYCDWVIFNDQFWTPAAHDQCEGRAYGRLSNPHAIDSFYVIADVMVEEFIQELLEMKLEIISATVEGVECSRDVSGSIAKALMEKMMAEMYKRD